MASRGTSRRRTPGVEALLARQARILVSSAIAGGLNLVRLRSAPERLDWEARRFLRLVGTAARPASERVVDAAVGEEARIGAFAGASVREVAAAFAVWRRVLESFAASLDTPGDGIGAALGLLEPRMIDAVAGWDKERVDLIALGASAGGVTAIRALLGRLDPHLPASVVVVQHMSPRTPSLLASVLARATPLPILPAVEGGRLYFGYAYLAAPGRHLLVDREFLHLVDGPMVHFVKPSVDVLFESAAGAWGPRLASVVLSGTGADGATGTLAVHEHGGVTFAQSPDDSEFRGMPEAAIATGAVDRVADLEKLPALLTRLTTGGRRALAR